MELFTNQYLKNYVITGRGVLEASDIVPGDIVYSYNGSKPLEVIGTRKSPMMIISKLHYNDGRVQYVQHGETILNGNELKTFDDHVSDNPLFAPETNLVDFNSRTIPENINPYEFALVFFGDTSIPFANMASYPLVCNDYKTFGNQTFMHEICYNYDLLPYLYKGKFYFKTTNLSDLTYNEDELITWKDLFPNIDVTENHILYQRFRYASFYNRIRLVRGIFDLTFNPKSIVENHEISIYNPSEDNLKDVQSILWSIGINSKVEYTTRHIHSEYEELDTSDLYKLTILDDIYDSKVLSLIFNNYEALEELIKDESDLLHHKSGNPLEVERIVSRLGYGYTTDLILKERDFYLTENYLPKYSVL